MLHAHALTRPFLSTDRYNVAGKALKPGSSQIKRFCRKGIPMHLRAHLWISVSGAGASMKKNPGYYAKMLEDSGGVLCILLFHLNHPLQNPFWFCLLFCCFVFLLTWRPRGSIHPTFVGAGFPSQEKWKDQIKLDLHRTFPDNVQFRPDGCEKQLQLGRVLQAYAVRSTG